MCRSFSDTPVLKHTYWRQLLPSAVELTVDVRLSKQASLLGWTQTKPEATFPGTRAQAKREAQKTWATGLRIPQSQEQETRSMHWHRRTDQWLSTTPRHPEEHRVSVRAEGPAQVMDSGDAFDHLRRNARVRVSGHERQIRGGHEGRR